VSRAGASEEVVPQWMLVVVVVAAVVGVVIGVWIFGALT
jgi:hypothetical protein